MYDTPMNYELRFMTLYDLYMTFLRVLVIYAVLCAHKNLNTYMNSKIY